MPPTKAVPSGRLARLASFGGIAGAITGNVLKESAKQLLKGQTPNTSSVLLHPSNALSLVNRLAHLRGAAMKVGQLLAMDAGDFLPPEWSAILGRLKQNADPMPKSQLLKVLAQEWGDNWQSQFSYFSLQPIAAASIGQVHEAVTNNNQRLAIKVQYPGVRDSIDSDIGNIASLIRIPGLLPKNIDLSSLLQEAKAQLHQEADYLQEAEFLHQYREKLSDESIFVVPFVNKSLTTPNILAMEYIDAEPIETLATKSTETKDKVITALFALLFAELFDFGFMQSDPNFANYLYQSNTGKIVLLDFGACCSIDKEHSTRYLHLANAMAEKDSAIIKRELIALGLLSEKMRVATQQHIINACLLAGECLHSSPYNIAEQNLIARIQAVTQPLTQARNDIMQTPDFQIALMNRKITGTVLLANTLKASVDYKGLLSIY